MEENSSTIELLLKLPRVKEEEEEIMTEGIMIVDVIIMLHKEQITEFMLKTLLLMLAGKI
jgi:hypothetical protein